MRTLSESCDYSIDHVGEIVEFAEIFDHGILRATGFFLNGKLTKEYCTYYLSGGLMKQYVYEDNSVRSVIKEYRPDSSIKYNYFCTDTVRHGEFRYYKNGKCDHQYFIVKGVYVEELDYLIDTERDDAFYFTLSLYGIDKECTFN